MNTEENRLTKIELQLLLAELEPAGIDSTDSSGVPSGRSGLEQSLQAELKMRLEKAAEEMRARNEPVPPNLMDLLERL
jgi:hypothetical protein